MRAAVVGHVEWMEFVPVEHVPRPGEIVHAAESWEQAAGGGVVAAVQFAELADSVQFFTALGTDERGRRAKVELEERGIEVHASSADGPQRSGFTFVDESGERADDEHDNREPSRLGMIRAEEHDDDRDQRDPSDRQDVRPAQPERSHSLDDGSPPTSPASNG